MELISFIAAIVNAGLIAFTSDITDGHTWVARIWIFFGISVLLISIKSIVQMITPDIPVDVDIQLQRNKYYMDKILYDIADEDDSLLTKDIGIDTEYAIRITDDDPL